MRANQSGSGQKPPLILGHCAYFAIARVFFGPRKAAPRAELFHSVASHVALVRILLEAVVHVPVRILALYQHCFFDRVRGIL